MLSDIALELLQSEFGTQVDLAVQGRDLVGEDSFRTATILSIFSDARADYEDDPDLTCNRRGWWGDMLSTIPNDKWGSKLWLLDRAKQTNQTRIKAQEYATEALQWMIDDGIAQKISVVADYPQRGFLRLAISITKPSGDILEFAFDYAWRAEGEK